LGDLTASLPDARGVAFPRSVWRYRVAGSALERIDSLLRRCGIGMVELGNGGMTQADLRIDERMLHQLAGVPYLDQRLASMMPLEAKRRTAHANASGMCKRR